MQLKTDKTRFMVAEFAAKHPLILRASEFQHSDANTVHCIEQY